MRRCQNSIVCFLKLILVLFLVFPNAKANGQKTFYAERATGWENIIPDSAIKLQYTVYLIGDTKTNDFDSGVLKLLHSKLADSPINSALVVLGDIVYPLGISDSADKHFKPAVAGLNQILSVIKGYKGKIYFTPGNHDWAKGKKEGWNNVLNEEKYIEDYFNRGNIYLPDNGCPGPVEINLTDDIVLILFDSQWWFQKNDKPDLVSDCDYDDPDALFLHIEDALRRNSEKKIIFASHHPLFSVGEHGGFFPAEYNLFPLLEANKYLWIPLPGFIYTGYRKLLGDIQDIAHPEYKDLRKNLLDIFDDYPDLIYAAGHEHNLQYLEKKNLHHIVTGGGGEATYISKRKKKADFAVQSTGFSVLKFYENGDVWVEFLISDGSVNGKMVFRKKLFNKPVFNPEEKQKEMIQLDYSDSTVKVMISNGYEAGKFKEMLLGENYRELYEQCVDLPVFDIGTEKGGLTIIKRGGGQQTLSVRLKDKNGKQYVLRSTDKYINRAMDNIFENTIVNSALQDANSATHPFSAVTVPIMADAVGVMHTNPKYVWVPDDPRLGVYRKDLANGVFLFEERPAGNFEDLESFGHSEKIVSTPKVIKKTEKKQNHKVDQLSVLRARLFDLFLNDWDRHDDQWRWASFKENGKTVYKPIPRDRDQVFFANDGFLVWFARINFSLRKFQKFDYKVRNVNALSYNARYFDRSFLTETNLNEWMQTAHYLQLHLSDSVIETAINSLPEQAFQSTGPDIIDKLKTRRNTLPEYSKELYLTLAKSVDVVGTYQREMFVAERLPNGNTNIDVFSLNTEKYEPLKLLYHRKFKYNETKEIRLFGLKGKDEFHISGNAKKGIIIRVIGGKGNDAVIDSSSVDGLGRKTIVYDRKDKKNTIIKSHETKLRLSNDKSVNEYNRKLFKYNKVDLLLNAGYNIDDGVLLGGGARFYNYQFRDSTIQTIRGSVAIQTGAFALNYQGIFSSISRKFNLILDAAVSIPRNVDNYFGLGNETVKLTNNKTYYRARYQYIYLNPLLNQQVNDHFDYSFGVFYQSFMLNDTAGRFIGDISVNDLDSAAYNTHHFVGINGKLAYDTRDNKALPSRGMVFNADVKGFYGLNKQSKNFVRLKTDISFYLSFRKDPRVVFAIRAGGAANFGNYEFYHANFLGRTTNLRGFRSNRFAGDISLYQNTEIRIKLLNLKAYLFNGQAGLLVFNDLGRVWVQGEDSKRWHNGYGAGLWLTPFNYTALILAYSRSEEESMINFTFRYFF